MNIHIITGQISGIHTALQGMGFRDMQSIVWIRSPVRIDGVWHAEVRHG